MKFANPRLVVFFLCFFLFALVAKGQYYPGGLSNTNLTLWLDANDLTTITKNAGNQVSIWADKSIPASPLTLAQATAANQPVYTTAGINARPSLTFKGASDQYLALQSTAAPVTTYFQGYSKFSHFCVYKSTNTIITTLYGREFLWKTQISAGTGALHLWASATGAAWGTSLASSVPIPVNTNALISAVYNSAGTYDGYNLGRSVGSIALGGQVLGNNGNGFTVGARTAGPEPLTGSMGEVLIFNRNLLNSERIIMENYLSAKWGIALSANIHYTAPTATTYGTNLVGIGYATASDNLTSTAQTDGLGFSSGTTATDFLNAAGYLMAAHNGQANTVNTKVVISGIGNAVNYWNRSWYLNATRGNSSGTVTLKFDFSAYNGSALPGASNYLLLYNATDGSFATGTNQVVAVNSTVSGTTASFPVKASSLANGYYTIMWWPSGAGISPSALVVCAGSNAGFTASTLNGCNYQWQVNTGSGFANVPATDPSGAVYSGAGSATLGITGGGLSMNGYAYQVVLTAPNGPAITEGPAALTLNPVPAAQSLSASANPICLGSSTTLSMVSPVAEITYNIYSDAALTVNVGSLTSAANALVLSPAATTTYYEQAVDGTTGCVQTAASQTITVQVVVFSLSLTANPNPVVAGYPVSLLTNATTNYTVLSWSPPGLFPNQTALTQAPIMTDTSKTISVIAVSANGGCPDTASVTVVVQPNPTDLFIPNAFTPNGDGRNDVFKVYGSSVKEIELKIFSQWGQLIFESHDVQRGWDGTYGGRQQPAGIYLYGIKIVLFGQPAPITRRGSLSLIR